MIPVYEHQCQRYKARSLRNDHLEWKSCTCKMIWAVNELVECGLIFGRRLSLKVIDMITYVIIKLEGNKIKHVIGK